MASSTDSSTAPQGADTSRDGALSAELSALLVLSVELARGVEGDLDAALRTALDVCDPVAVEESILQSYLFLGFPTALNAFAVWRKVSGRAASPAEPGDWASWRARGADVCGRVYGGQYEGLRENIRALSTEMEEWMVVEGYGKVLGRPGLSLLHREYCIVAVLATQGVSRQLYSHLRGALQVGGPPTEVEAVLHAVAARLPEGRAGVARDTWNRLSKRKDH